MAVVFESTIKNDGIGGWYIELKDTTDNRVEICKDIKEYEEKIEKLGEDYGGRIDEVKWLKDDDVDDLIMNEVRIQMQEARENLNIE
jgi:hypothetical protein